MTMKEYKYDIDYRLDDRYGEEDFTEEVTTKKEIRKDLKNLKDTYGIRVVYITIKRWEYIDGELNEWVNAWSYKTIDEAISNF